MRWDGHVACIGEQRAKYRVLMRKHERKRLLGRPRHRWAYNIKMNLQEMESGAVPDFSGS